MDRYCYRSGDCLRVGFGVSQSSLVVKGFSPRWHVDFRARGGKLLLLWQQGQRCHCRNLQALLPGGMGKARAGPLGSESSLDVRGCRCRLLQLADTTVDLKEVQGLGFRV